MLKGASGVLARAACVNCELIDEHCRRYGHAMGDVIALLQRAGFIRSSCRSRAFARVHADFVRTPEHTS